MDLTPQEQLELLQEKLFVLKKRINRLKKELGQPLIDEAKVHQCKRCNYQWRGRIVHRDPTHCPHCHSALWFEEPVKRSEKWVPDPSAYFPRKKRTFPQPKHHDPIEAENAAFYLPPPPKFERLSLSEQLAERMKANVSESHTNSGRVEVSDDPSPDPTDDRAPLEDQDADNLPD